MGIIPEPDELEALISAAMRITDLERCDELLACVHVWNSGLGKNPWMFEIRRAGCLYGSFMDVKTGYETRIEAERMGIKICESMFDGSFQETYTFMRTKCPRCQTRVNEHAECPICVP